MPEPERIVINTAPLIAIVRVNIERSRDVETVACCLSPPQDLFSRPYLGLAAQSQNRKAHQYFELY
jgi:hypothetical protein